MPFSPDEADAQPNRPEPVDGQTAATGTAGAGVWQTLAGAPFLALALTPLLAFGPAATLAAFLSSALAAFAVHIPIVAGIFGLADEERAAGPLPARGYALLLLLWVATDWAIAALWR